MLLKVKNIDVKLQHRTIILASNFTPRQVNKIIENRGSANICRLMFIVKLFTTANRWKQHATYIERNVIHP